MLQFVLVTKPRNKVCTAFSRIWQVLIHEPDTHTHTRTHLNASMI